MDPNLAVALLSLLFTIVGSVAAVLTIRQAGDPKPTHITGSVAPDPALRLLGHRVSLLAAEVARQLKLRLLVVRTLVPAIRFGDPVEGMISAAACVLIADDIASDGELLVRTAARLRAHGARVSNCVCAVERMDGNSRDRLGKHDVNLHAPIQLDEQTLRDLAHLPPEQNEESADDGRIAHEDT